MAALPDGRGRPGDGASRWRPSAALLAASDVVFTSVGTTLPVIDRPMLERRPLAGRPAGTPLLVIDLGMPRNVEPSAADLEGLTLLDMDVLRAAVDDALSGRQDEVAGANRIVTDEVERYRVASRARDAAPMVSALRARVEEARQSALDRQRASAPS